MPSVFLTGEELLIVGAVEDLGNFAVLVQDEKAASKYWQAVAGLFDDVHLVVMGKTPSFNFSHNY